MEGDERKGEGEGSRMEREGKEGDEKREKREEKISETKRGTIEKEIKSKGEVLKRVECSPRTGTCQVPTAASHLEVEVEAPAGRRTMPERHSGAELVHVASSKQRKKTVSK